VVPAETGTTFKLPLLLPVGRVAPSRPTPDAETPETADLPAA